MPSNWSSAPIRSAPWRRWWSRRSARVSVVRMLIAGRIRLRRQCARPRIDPAAYLPDPGAWMICALGRHRDHARRDPDRGCLPPQLACRRWARPAIGGLVVGLLALITPQVLSSGPCARCRPGSTRRYSLQQIALLIVLKARRLGDIDRLRVPRRAVLRLAVPRRPARQAVRRLPGHGDRRQCRARGGVRHRRHERRWQWRWSAARSPWRSSRWRAPAACR